MKIIPTALLIVYTAMLLSCSGGGGATQTTSLSGTVTFPSIPVAPKAVAGSTTSPTMEIRDLSGALAATLTLGLQAGTTTTYNYPATRLDRSKDYVLKAVNGSLVLRALLNKEALAGASASKSVDVVSTTAITIVEQSIQLPLGAFLGQTAATSAQLAALALLPASANIESGIAAAMTACADTGSASAAQAQLASFANIVSAAVTNQLDPAAFIAGTLDTASVLASTYAVSDADAVTTTSDASITPAQAAVFAGIALPRISGPHSATFTTGAFGSTTMIGTGTFVSSGTLPPGVAFDSAVGMLNGTPASGSKGVYPLIITATNLGFSVSQPFSLTVVQGAASDSSALKSVLQSGMYEAESQWYQNAATAAVQTYYAASNIKLAADGVSITQTFTYFNNASGAWSTALPAGVAASLFGISAHYYLTAGGWVSDPYGDSPTGYTPSFNSDGTATLTRVTDGSTSNISITSNDISNQSIGIVAAGLSLPWPILSTAGKFPSGSVRYDLTKTELSGYYSLSPNNTAATALDQIPTQMPTVGINTSSGSYIYYAQFNGSSAADIYQQGISSGQAVKVGSGSYAIVTVAGQQIFEISIPTALRTKYQLGGNPIFSVVGGQVLQGQHYLPGVNYRDSGSEWNGIAIQQLQNFFSP